MKCSPCYKPDCKKFKCIKQIDVNEIVEAVEKLTPHLRVGNIKDTTGVSL